MFPSRIQCAPHSYSRLFRPWDMAQLTTAAAAQETIQAPNLPQDERAAEAMNANNESQNLTRNGDKIDIKVELVKDEDAADDEELEVDDEELEVDDEEYLHRRRSSECASSRSNYSQLSDGSEFPHSPQNFANSTVTASSQFPTISAPLQSEDVYGLRLQRRHTMPSTPSFHSLDTYQQHQLLPNYGLPTSAPAPPILPRQFFYSSNALNGITNLNSPPIAPSLPMATSSSAAAAAAAATATNFVGMGSYGYNVMGQEYLRIMTEEAHLKAINARKQRPKKFKCPHCDVAFSNNGQLKGHIRIHTGERPFKCDVESCGKTFTRNEELTRHKRIHTGIRPYSCTVCAKRFGRRDHLKKHMKTHLLPEQQMGPTIFVPMYSFLYGH